MRFIDILKSKLIKGTIFLALGSFFSKFIIYVSSILLLRYLTKDDFGRYELLRGFVASYSLFTTFGLGIAATRFFSDNDETIKKRFFVNSLSISLLTSLLIILISVVFKDEISSIIFKDKIDYHTYLINVSCLFFVSIFNIRLGELIGELKYTEAFVFQITQSLTFATILLIGVYVNRFYINVSYAISFLPLFFYVLWKKNNSLRISYISELTLSPILKFTLPVFISSIMTAPVMWGLQSRFTINEVSMVELGLYLGALIIPNIIAGVAQILNNVLMPLVFRHSSRELEHINFIGVYSIFMLIFFGIQLNTDFILRIINFNVNDKTELLLNINLLILLPILFRQGYGRIILKEKKNNLSVISMSSFGIVLIYFSMYVFDLTAINFSLSVLVSYLVNDVIFFFLLLPLYKIKTPTHNRFYLLFYISSLFICVSYVGIKYVF